MGQALRGEEAVPFAFFKDSTLSTNPVDFPHVSIVGPGRIEDVVGGDDSNGIDTVFRVVAEQHDISWFHHKTYFEKHTGAFVAGRAFDFASLVEEAPVFAIIQTDFASAQAVFR